MSITGYYVPNRVSNEYVANKRNDQGVYEYDTYLQDVGIETNAAIQSLNKDYSATINNAYSQYLNAKNTIASSNMGQGYKEAYLQNQQEALRANSAQASLTAAETKRQILQQAYEQQNAIGSAFQNEVNNMEQVGTMLSGYMEYLKGVTNKNGSYYDAILSGKGLSDYTGDIYAEDLYDELYNAQPGLKDNMYTDEDGKVALGWTDWLNTQIKTDKQQKWYDWYMGQGGYEQFQDAYKKGIYTKEDGGVAAYLAEQKRKQEYEAAKTKAQEEYNIEKYNAEQTWNKTKEDATTTADKNYSTSNAPKLDLHWTDYGWLDTGAKAKDKIAAKASEVDAYMKQIGLTNDDLKAIGYNNSTELLNDIIKAGELMNNGYTFSEVFASGKGFNEGFKRFMYSFDRTYWKGITQGKTQANVEKLFDEAMRNLYRTSEHKKAGILGDFKYDKKFEFASYEDYYK
jgi:hypothetical protein